MPDADVWINPGAPPGTPDDMIANIDNGNIYTDRYFSVENDGGGVTHRQFTVFENGDVLLRGPLQRAGTIDIRRTGRARARRGTAWSGTTRVRASSAS
jgi:hypothetical protein